MSTAPPPKKPQSDVRKRSVLPSTLNLLAAAQSSSAAASINDLTSDEYLDKMEEELNRSVDKEVEGLVDGMGEIVAKGNIEGRDHHQLSLDSFQIASRTESMIRSTHTLLSLVHTLKLLHLFSDTATPTLATEKRAKELEKEIEVAKARVRALVQ
ncbi:hypothetical protein MNV49_004974 [Pseudohyphozyma bogoriensis]|nr:hypothetical protein MNV49_004974 [Pseudohyphozyma bogoriensis]